MEYTHFGRKWLAVIGATRRRRLRLIGVLGHDVIHTGRRMSQATLVVPDERRAYVTPEEMREHMITLFDAQRAYERRLSGVVFFQPGKVDYNLGLEGSVREYTEATRLWLYYRDVLLAAHYHLLRLFDHSGREEGSDEDVLVLDHASITERLRQGNRGSLECRGYRGTLVWNTVDEVYESISMIGVMSLREQRDRRQRELREQRKGNHPLSFVEWCRRGG